MPSLLEKIVKISRHQANMKAQIDSKTQETFERLISDSDISKSKSKARNKVESAGSKVESSGADASDKENIS